MGQCICSLVNLRTNGKPLSFMPADSVVLCVDCTGWRTRMLENVSVKFCEVKFLLFQKMLSTFESHLDSCHVVMLSLLTFGEPQENGFPTLLAEATPQRGSKQSFQRSSHRLRKVPGIWLITSAAKYREGIMFDMHRSAAPQECLSHESSAATQCEVISCTPKCFQNFVLLQAASMI